MKYIRTKDGVYELKENMTIENGVYSFFGKIYDTTEKHLFRNDKDLGEFVSQSENLDDLCDEFIDEEQHYIIQNKEIIREIPNNQTLKNHTIYGAIWTSKGLIYVAKMNSEGKLELI